jgi:hypothetical protein
MDLALFGCHIVEVIVGVEAQAYSLDIAICDWPVDHHLENLRCLVCGAVHRCCAEEAHVVARPSSRIIPSMNNSPGSTPHERYSGGTTT